MHQRIHCVNTGGLEEGRALQETVIQTGSSQNGHFLCTGTEFQSGSTSWVHTGGLSCHAHKYKTLIYQGHTKMFHRFWGAAIFINIKRGHNKGITYYYLIMESSNGALLLSFTCSPGDKGRVADVNNTRDHGNLKALSRPEREEKMGRSD